MSKHQNDFIEFLNTDAQAVPEAVTRSILQRIHADLRPSVKLVFLKLLSIQAFIGFLTLTFCPQFALSLTNQYELFHYLHHTFGEMICLSICGGIFIGSGAIFAAYLLKPSELHIMSKYSFLNYLALSILAVSIFFTFGAEIYLNALMYWLLGALSFGLFFFHLNKMIRISLTYKSV